MGGCCECIKCIFSKKINYNDFDYIKISEKNSESDFDLEAAKEAVKICLSEDKYPYCTFCDNILSFNEDDFKILFKGLLEQKKDELYDKYNKNEEEKKNFDYLIAKFENFQILLTQWYKKSEYYEYLKALWIKFPLMSDLKNYYFDDNKLSKYLKNIGIQYDEWDEDIKEEFKKCILASAEVKSCEISNFIRYEYPEFEELIRNTLKYKTKLGNHNKEVKMDDCEENLIIVSKNLIKDFVGNWFSKKEQISDIKGDTMLKESIISKINSFLFKEYDKDDDDEDSLFDMEKVETNFSQLVKVLKEGKLLDDLKSSIKFLNGADIIGGITVGLSLLNLSNEIYKMYRSFKKCDNINYKFKERLNIIKNNFEEHKNIGILPNNYNEKYYETINIIIQITKFIKKDYEDIIDLINDIEVTIKNKKAQHKKSGKKIIKGCVKVAVGIAGVALSGGLGAIACGIAASAHTMGVIRHGIKFHKEKKQLKNLKLTKKESDELKRSIEIELDNLYDLYIEISKRHFPSYDNEYSDDDSYYNDEKVDLDEFD